MPINSFLYPAPSTPSFVYNVANSLRFNGGSSDYLNVGQASGNRKTFTFSAWVKRNSFARGVLFSCGTSLGSQENGIEFDSTVIRCYSYTGSFGYNITTNAKYRDSAAWMHVVFALDLSLIHI